MLWRALSLGPQRDIPVLFIFNARVDFYVMLFCVAVQAQKSTPVKLSLDAFPRASATATNAERFPGNMVETHRSDTTVIPATLTLTAQVSNSSPFDATPPLCDTSFSLARS